MYGIPSSTPNPLFGIVNFLRTDDGGRKYINAKKESLENKYQFLYRYYDGIK